MTALFDFIQTAVLTVVSAWWDGACALTAYLFPLVLGPLIGLVAGVAIVETFRWFLIKKTGLPVLMIGKRKPKDEE